MILLKMIHIYIYNKRLGQNLRREERRGKNFELTKGRKRGDSSKKKPENFFQNSPTQASN